MNMLQEVSTMAMSTWD